MFIISASLVAIRGQSGIVNCAGPPKERLAGGVIAAIDEVTLFIIGKEGFGIRYRVISVLSQDFSISTSNRASGIKTFIAEVDFTFCAAIIV
jgi:hypothetical protein